MEDLKSLLLRIPGVGQALRSARREVRRRRFQGSADYWESRYASEGDSGAGSFGRLAEFKASVVNEIVAREAIDSVVELGCGDGNQLALLNVPRYLGLDVSASAVRRCIHSFGSDPSKSFAAYDPSAFHDRGGWWSADLSLSMDVIYHLIEDSTYRGYLEHLFVSARRFVLVYSSDVDEITPVVHVRHRKFTSDVAAWFPEWQLVEHIPNAFPAATLGIEEGSVSDFYLFRRRGGEDATKP